MVLAAVQYATSWNEEKNETKQNEKDREAWKQTLLNQVEHVFVVENQRHDVMMTMMIMARRCDSLFKFIYKMYLCICHDYCSNDGFDDKLFDAIQWL